MVDRLQRVAHLVDIVRDELDREVIDHPELPVLVFLRDQTATLQQQLWTAHREYADAEADAADH